MIKLKIAYYDSICFTCYSIIHIFGVDSDAIRKIWTKACLKLETWSETSIWK